MPYSETTEYPRGISHTASQNSTATEIFAAGQEAKISSIVIAGGAANREVTFRRAGAGATYMIANVATNGCIEIRRGFQTDDGLEILTNSVTADVDITIFYFTT